MFNTGDRFCTVEVCFHSKLHLSSSSKATTPFGLQNIKLACCLEFLEYTSLLFMMKLVVKNRMNLFPKATAYLAFLLVILSNLSERLPIWRFNSFRDNLSNLWEKALLWLCDSRFANYLILMSSFLSIYSFLHFELIADFLIIPYTFFSSIQLKAVLGW